MVLERADADVAAHAGPSGEYMADAPTMGVQIARRSMEPVVEGMVGEIVVDGGSWNGDESREQDEIEGEVWRTRSLTPSRL